MAAIITPSSLSFSIDEKQPTITNVFTISNTLDECITYKVKTTRPKRYIVRPNVGIITGKGIAEIQVVLNPKKDPPHAEEQDRFQVLCLPVKPEEADDPKTLWKSKEKTEGVTKKTLSVTFKMPSPSSPTLKKMSFSEQASNITDASVLRDRLFQVEEENARLKKQLQSMERPGIVGKEAILTLLALTVVLFAVLWKWV
eukprot:CAMPEP_0177653022 /NCGR_PEP_ID=MMETSP0447-20121125/13486_1 /TAXON_ID=0 /ORGANISM="Stygamoeba regulata, Strain BSH-02190019" /LENGTH=198 /DNA_ID=CAMNT_0019156395 /DNA_START=112 /DNA_END=708 /DNA_ORIENTATION=-